MKSEEDRIVCKAALRNDEQEIIKALDIAALNSNSQAYNIGKRSGTEESKFGGNNL